MATATVLEIHEAITCLQRLSSAFRRRRQQLAGGVGLTEQQWSVLEEISTEHFMPSMFARSRESTAAAVSKVVRQLVDKGLVNVSLSPSDGRQREYVLTSKGSRTIGLLRERREAAIERIWRTMPPEDVRRFISFGNHLTARLEEYARESREQ